MSSFPVRATYATPKAFKSYLNSTTADEWSADDAGLLTLMESVSRAIDACLRYQSVHPRIETHHYDLASVTQGYGYPYPYRLTSNDRYPSSWDPIYVEQTRPAGVRIPLADWLLAPSEVAAYTSTNESSRLIYLVGSPGSVGFIASPSSYQVWLDPEDEPQKRFLALNEAAAAFFYGGQRTVEVSGTWGWQNVTLATDTLGAAISSPTTTTITLATPSSLTPGQAILVDAEQMYVRATPTTTTATVIRGVNGTTAATHLVGATVSTYEEPPEIIEAALDIARCRWRGRQMGTTMQIADPTQGMSIPSPAAEERQILKRLHKPFLIKGSPLQVF